MSSSTYNYEEEDDGKVLTKSQLKRSMCEDQSRANVINKDLSDEAIRIFVVNLLVTRGDVEVSTAHNLMDKQGIRIMRQAFTHWTMKGEANYEVLETLGDTTYNKVIAYYIYRRFPELSDDDGGNYKLTESCKLYKSKNQAPIFSDKLGLPGMARYKAMFYRPQPQTFPNKILQIKMDNKFKTDLFEAFIAAIEEIIDCRVCAHSGYSVVYNIMQTLLDEVEIKITLSDTKNNKAKLKEVVDRLDGELVYTKFQSSTGETSGVTLRLNFPRKPVHQLNGASSYGNRFTANVKGFDAACDQASLQALNWLEQSCGIKW